MNFEKEVDIISKKLVNSSNEELFKAYKKLCKKYKENQGINYILFIEGYFKTDEKRLNKRLEKQRSIFRAVHNGTWKEIILFEIDEGTLKKPVLITSEYELVEIYNKYSEYEFI